MPATNSATHSKKPSRAYAGPRPDGMKRTNVSATSNSTETTSGTTWMLSE